MLVGPIASAAATSRGVAAEIGTHSEVDREVRGVTTDLSARASGSRGASSMRSGGGGFSRGGGFGGRGGGRRR